MIKIAVMVFNKSVKVFLIGLVVFFGLVWGSSLVYAWPDFLQQAVKPKETEFEGGVYEAEGSFDFESFVGKAKAELREQAGGKSIQQNEVYLTGPKINRVELEIKDGVVSGVGEVDTIQFEWKYGTVGGNPANSVKYFFSGEVKGNQIFGKVRKEEGGGGGDWVGQIDKEKIKGELVVERPHGFIVMEPLNFTVYFKGEGPSLSQRKVEAIMIKAVRGEVEIDKGGNDVWETAGKGAVLEEGDYLSTGFETEVDLVIGDHQVTLNEMTDVEIDSLLKAAEDPEKLKEVVMDLRVGSLRFLSRLKSLNKKPVKIITKFEVVTPTATVAVRGTDFNVSYDKASRETKVYVREGEVEVADEQNREKVVVKEGEQTRVLANELPEEPKSVEGVAEEERWWEEGQGRQGWENITWVYWLIGGGLVIGLAGMLVKRFKRKK